METTRTTPTPRPGARSPRSRRLHRGLAALLAGLVLVPALAFAAGRGGGPVSGPDGLGPGFGGPGFFAAAAEGEGNGEGLHRLPLRRLAFFLVLTEAQVTEAQAIFEAARTEAEPLRTDRRDLARQLRDALEAAEPDPAAVGALTIALHDSGEALRAVIQGAIEDFEAILTAEQAERFQILREVRRVFGRGHHGPGPGGPAAEDGA